MIFFVYHTVEIGETSIQLNLEETSIQEKSIVILSEQ